MVRWTANPSAGDVPPASRSFAAFIGLDKSDKKINVSLQRCGTAKIERSIIKGGAEALHWLALYYKSGPLSSSSREHAQRPFGAFTTLRMLGEIGRAHV